ncbi:MAG: hypothetical protein J6R59_02235 [Paludibacteraceae bacterium]|nr:hypothetical protein [Paludibacteraceae bacterium]
MIKKRVKSDGEPLTLDGLMSELNNLFASRKDDPKAMDIKSMIQSLVNGEACFEEKDEDDAMTACPDGLDPEGIDISNEDLSGGMIGYNSITEASKADGNIMTTDIYGVDMPIIAFIAPNHMMEGVVETIRSMARPLIVAKECVGGAVNVVKASIACGKKRETLIKKNGTINALAFDEKSGMCRLSINRKDGYDFIFGENGVTRFIIFDESSCPATIPTDIVQDDRKWGKRMTSEIPKLIEERIEKSKSEEKKLPFADAVKPYLTKFDIPNFTEKKSAMCNLPETCTFEDTPDANIKQPIISDIMKDFADAKGSGKIGKDTFVEFMKPENKEAVASAVATSIAEHQNPSEDVIEKDEVIKAVESAIFEDDSDDFTDEDTNPDCFRCIAEYMAKEGVDSINFWTDCDGLIHCDVQIKTVYKVELEDSDKK